MSRIPQLKQQDFGVADYRIGETVKKTKGGTGVIRAIFKTMQGEECYVIDNEGSLDFLDKTRMLPVSGADLAVA
jgi:hypothetical protein